KNAVRYRKNFVEAYLLLIKSALISDDVDLAFAVAEKALEVVPGNNMLLNSQAVVYIRSGDLDPAKNIAMDLIKKNPKFTPAYITLGNVYYLEGKYELARLVYLKAIEHSSDNKDLYTCAREYCILNPIEREDYSGELYTGLGLVSLKLGDKISAFNYLKKSTEQAPYDPFVRLNYGKFCLESGDYEAAVSEFKTALRFNPRLAEAIVDLGTTYAQIKLFNEAEELYRRAASYRPDYAETYFNYGILLWDYRSDLAGALKMFNRFVALKGDTLKQNDPVYKYIKELQQKRQGAVKK
ncbi:MAG: tetratricopeptide repeat protein, partial [Pseudomonadota bacterium]